MGLTILDLREARAVQSAKSAKSAVTQIQAASPVIFQSQDPSGFRRISGVTSGRDLQPPTQDRMQAVAFYLAITNPAAKRIVEITKDFVVGEGVKVKAEDEDVQAEIDAFWSDPVNSMALSLHEYVRELAIFGELCLMVASNPVNGRTRLGYIDPAYIEEVKYATLEALPGVAVTVAETVVLRQQLGEKTGRRLSIIHRDEDPNSETYGEMIGDCFYFAINKARAGTRGISDLFAVADWVDGYDQMLFAMMKHMDLLTRFIWDVRMDGMTEEQLTDYAAKHSTPPKSGTVRFHNEKATWTALSPSIGASDKSEGARMIKNMALGGAGLPEHWFAEGGTTNRATALEQGEPTLKMLTSRQILVKAMIAQIAELVIDRKIGAGVLSQDVNRNVAVEMPDLSPRDQVKAATAMGTAMQGLTLAQTAHAVDRKSIARILAMLAQPLGIELDVDEILAAAAQEETDAELKDYTRTPPPGSLEPQMNTDEQG